ncbi:hypothetical protein [Paenibacillus sp. WLX2291]|uniref:hypothetical protein n=1 Tax=Paenibacillus sp. WLX2291 TaxID=3296934 RepID=UPI0039840852
MYRNLNTGVVEIDGKLTMEEAKEIARLSSIRTLQFTAALEWQSYHYINHIILPACPDMTVRAYHFHGQVCDLAFVEQLPDLRSLAVLCQGEFVNLDCIAALPQLQRLNVQLHQLDSFDFLQQVNPQLSGLTLGQTASKKPSLQGIARFEQLHELTVEGHRKQIEEIAQLTHLQKLSLRYLTLPDVNFLRQLPELWWLQIYTGGTNELGALAELKQLKYIDLSQIRGLDQLDFLSSMTGLQYIRIGAMPHIHELPALNQLKQLRKIELYNMKGLQRLDSLQHPPALTEFIQREAWEMEAEYYIPLLQNPALQRAYVHLRNEKKFTRFRQLLEEHGKKNAADEQSAGRTSWLTTDFPFE